MESRSRTLPEMKHAPPVDEASVSLNRLLVLVFLLVVVLAITVDGCDVELGFVDRGITDAVIVENHTTMTIDVIAIAVDGRPLPPQKLLPGERLSFFASQLVPVRGADGPRCTVGDVTAFAADGHEVARHAPPLCAPGVWEIEQPANSTNPKSS
jgi:hypothetical protein